MIKFVVVLYFFALTYAKICPPDKDIGQTVKAMDRLPDHVTPLSYNITLEPIFDKFIFIGSVSISIKCQKETDKIVMHANKLKTTKVELLCKNDIKINNVTSNNDFLTLSLNTNMTINETCDIHFKNFQGILSDQERSGLYLAKYMEEGNEKVFATTQFEKTGARKVFPCFDEPHFKATVIVNLIRHKNFTTISNEEILTSITLESDRIRDVYKKTKQISTYLLAFIITEYSSTKTIQAQRVFADKTAIKNGDAKFALDTGIKVLSALEKFTNYRYSFTKIDQIGIPDAYFDPGAMENWGLVTYRKSYIIYPYDHQNTRGFQKTVSIISHEYSHQWFGNLVTCAWWKYTWLNEGFADYFEYFAAAMVGWDLKDIFVMDSVHNALGQDSVITTSPMNSEEATTIVVYQKAGSVIRMLSHIVTEDIFQKSLELYLRTNQYKSASPTELYQAFHETIEKENKTSLLQNYTISQIMTSWDSQPGYPVLFVTKTKDTIKLKQNRFFSDGSNSTNETWIIPLTYVLEEDTENNFFTTTAQEWFEHKTIDLAYKSDGWVIFNKQQMGFYRVIYDEENWNRLVKQLNAIDHNKIHVLNRAQLIDDAFTFAKIGQMNYTDVLELSQYLTKEQDYVPIAVFLKHISEINNKLSHENGRTYYKFFIERLFTESILSLVTMEESANDTLKTKYLRIELINWLCKLGNEQCIRHALATYKQNFTISPDLQEPIYCGAMRIADKDTWTSLFNKIGSESNDLIRPRIINALGCSEDVNILSNYVQLILDENNSINALSGFHSIMNAGDVGVEFVWNYTVANFTTIKKLPSIILDIAKKLNTEEHQNQMNELASNNPDLNSTFQDALKLLQDNIEWNKKHGEEIKIWFEDYVNENNASHPKLNFTILLCIVLTTILTNYFK